MFHFPVLQISKFEEDRSLFWTRPCLSFVSSRVSLTWTRCDLDQLLNVGIFSAEMRKQELASLILPGFGGLLQFY